MLNKNSGQVATFGVRIWSGRVVHYQYRWMNHEPDCFKTAYKFEAYLVGKHADDYCIGYVRGSQADCTRAKEKYTDGCVCALSKVCVDTYTTSQYISTPLQFRVNLAKSTVSILESTSETHAALYDTMPIHPVPPRTVADITQISSSRNMDLMAMIKRISEKRMI